MSCGHRNNQRVTQQHKESLKIGRAVVSTWGKNDFWRCGAGRACGGPWEVLPPLPPAVVTDSKHKGRSSFVSGVFIMLQAVFINAFI